MRVNDVPDFPKFHFFSRSFSSAGGSEIAHLKKIRGGLDPIPRPLDAEHFSSFSTQIYQEFTGKILIIYKYTNNTQKVRRRSH